MVNRGTGIGSFGWVVLLAASAGGWWSGCSTIGPGSGDDEDDSGEADGGAGGPDAESPLEPFSTPRLIEPLSAPGFNDDDPTVTGDGLELFFNSNRDGSSDLYLSRRDSVDQPWGDPQPVVGTGINTANNNETAPEVSTDGLTLYFSSNRPGGKGSQDIYITRRRARGAAWSPPDLVPQLNSTAADYSPVEDQSGLVVFFYSSRDGTQDLFMATRPSKDDTWRLVTAVAELNSADDNQADPFISSDGLTLYFGSGAPNLLDLYVTRRLDRDSDFDPPQAIDELNTGSHDTDPWLSPEGRYLVLTSNRSGDNEIYESER